MNYTELHNIYIHRCNEALGRVLKQYFLPGSQVSQAAEYTLMNGGKRVRGVLAIAVCDLLAGNSQMADVFAAAIEMIHAFSLIHDDLPCMDDDDMRRGKPSAHIVYGEATALLAGDLLALEAFEVIADAQLEPKQLLAGAAELAKASGANGMIYGQELDLKYETEPADEAALHQIHVHKTGALIRAAAHLGVIAAGKKPEHEAAVTTYADNIGLVFQIVDDMLDVTSTEEALGKPIGSDKDNSKATFVSLYGMEKSKKEAARLTQKAISALDAAYGDKAAFLCAFAEQLLKRIH